MSTEDVNESPAPETPAPEPAPVEDRIKNMQSEYSRKLDNMTQAMAEQNRQIQELLAARQAAPQAPQPKANLKDLVYDDPDRFVREVEQRAIASADERFNQRVNVASATQAAVIDMQSKYAEFSQPGSDAAKLAIEKAGKLPAHLQNTPEGIRLAMMDAVSELGLVPASKRQQTARNQDDFSLSGSSGSAGRPRANESKAKVSQATMDWAALLGVPLDKPDRVKGLEKASQRKNWLKYED